MNLDLQGKRAIVCGSTQGIGKAAARQLALMGADITLVARNEKVLQEVLKDLFNDGQNHGYLCADFSQPEALGELAESFVRGNGPVHILVNNTGGPAGGPISQAGISAFRDTFEKHLVCNHLLARACLPGMQEAGYGRILNVISTSVKQPIPGLGVSNTIRAAVAGWAKTLSREVARHGITVNNVLPGATNTSRLTQLIDAKAKKSGKAFNEVARGMTAEIPAARFAEAEEIGNAIGFLASPAAAYINGVSLPVDGGRTACY